MNNVTCGRHTGEKRIASLVSIGCIYRSLPVREYSTLVGQFTSGFHGSLVDDGHDSVDFIESLLAVVLNPPHDKVVGDPKGRNVRIAGYYNRIKDTP